MTAKKSIFDAAWKILASKKSDNENIGLYVFLKQKWLKTKKNFLVLKISISSFVL